MTTTLGNTPPAHTVIHAGENGIHEMLSISGYELIVTTSHHSSEIRVFSRETTGEPKLIFNQHQGKIAGMAHVFEDVIASVDRTGRLITWQASTGNILSQLRSGKTGWNDVAITQDDKLQFFISEKTFETTIGVVTHTEGRDLRLLTVRDLGEKHSSIAIHANFCVTFGPILGRAIIWDLTTWGKLGELNISAFIFSVTLNDEMIVVASDRKLHVFANRPNYPLVAEFNPHDDFRPSRLQFIEPDVLLCTEYNNGINRPENAPAD